MSRHPNRKRLLTPILVVVAAWFIIGLIVVMPTASSNQRANPPAPTQNSTTTPTGGPSAWPTSGDGPGNTYGTISDSSLADKLAGTLWTFAVLLISIGPLTAIGVYRSFQRPRRPANPDQKNP